MNHIGYKIHVVMLVALFLTVTNATAQPFDSVQEKRTMKIIHPAKRHYFSLSFDLPTKMSNSFQHPYGFTASFLLSPVKRYQSSSYYFGLIASIAGKNIQKPIGVPMASNGKLNSSISTVFLGLTQRYFFINTSKAMPFIDLDLGWRQVYNTVDSEYTWYSTFLGYLPGGDDIYEEKSSGFSLGVSGGCYFQVIGLNGLIIKLGLVTGNKLKIAEPGSVYYTSRSDFQYKTGYTNSTYFVLSMGIMI